VIGLAVILSAARAEAQVGTGTMNVHVMSPAGRTLTQSTVSAVNLSIGFSRTTVFGAGNGAFAMTNLPAANGYAANVVSLTTTPNEICGGISGGVPIVANGTTITFVSLTCAMAGAAAVPGLGRYAPLLFVSLALVGAIAIRRWVRSGSVLR
jgi:hypothetical protein